MILSNNNYNNNSNNNKNTNNNNTQHNIYSAIIYGAKQIHMQEFTLGPLSESRSAPGGRQLLGQTANLTFESACRMLQAKHLPIAYLVHDILSYYEITAKKPTN